MPFIPPINRDRIKLHGPGACESVGDLCYVFYRHIMQVWNGEKRWRTAHRLYKNLEEQPEAYEFFQSVYSQVMNKCELDEVVCAAKLAYKVFFQLHVIPYEKDMVEKNGDIL